MLHRWSRLPYLHSRTQRRKTGRRLGLLRRPGLEALEDRVLLAPFVVDKIADSGPGSVLIAFVVAQPGQHGVDGHANHRPPEQPDRMPELTDGAHGTGSHPPAWKGWQRAIRAIAIRQPRHQPYLVIAS